MKSLLKEMDCTEVSSSGPNAAPGASSDKCGDQPAQLVFDSARMSSGVATRSSAASVRQLLYRSGPVCIDLHIQPRPGMVAAEVTGQLLDSRRPSHIMRDIPVSLLYDGGAVSHQTTNQVGEFDFRVDSPRHLQLVFGIGKRKSVVVTVPDALV